MSGLSPRYKYQAFETARGHNRQFDGTGGYYVNFYHTSYRQFERYPIRSIGFCGLLGRGRAFWRRYAVRP